MVIWEPFHQVRVAFTFLYPGLEFILRYVALTGAVKKLSPAGLWKILWSLFCCRLDPSYLLRKKYVAIDSLQKLHGINKASINTSILKVVIEILGTRLCLTVTSQMTETTFSSFSTYTWRDLENELCACSNEQIHFFGLLTVFCFNLDFFNKSVSA